MAWLMVVLAGTSSFGGLATLIWCALAKDWLGD
jgi:hypothetical protein